MKNLTYVCYSVPISVSLTHFSLEPHIVSMSFDLSLTEARIEEVIRDWCKLIDIFTV